MNRQADAALTDESKCAAIAQNSYELLVVESGRALFRNYMFVVFDPVSLDAVVIDPGWDAPFLADLIRQHALVCRAILVTHSHADHIAAASELARMQACPIYMSDIEAKTAGYGDPALRRTHGLEIIRGGSVVLAALPTPGHTSGSNCYLVGGYLFTGDTLFMEGGGLCTGSTGSVQDMFDSLQALKRWVPAETLVYPGHQYQEPIGQSFGFIRQKNVYLRIGSFKTFSLFGGRSGRAAHTPPPPSSATELGTRVLPRRLD